MNTTALTAGPTPGAATGVLTGLGAAIATDPALGSSGASVPGAPGTGDLFVALVAGLLDGAAPTTSDATAPEAAPEAGPEVGPEAASPEEVSPATVSPASPPSVASAATTPTVSAASAEVESPDEEPIEPIEPTDDGAAVALALLGVVPGLVPAARVTPAQVPPDADRGALAVTTTQQDRPQSRGPRLGTGADHLGPARTPTSVTEPAGGPAVDPTTSTGPAPVAPSTLPASLSATGPSAAPTAPAAPASTTTTATTAPTRPADPHRVIDQVFSQVVQVASSATRETSRVTIRLNPENLGEVRVVLAHRRGELHVSLAAGEQARATLADGSSELQRLLSASGHGDARIVLRDLAGGLAAGSSLTGLPTDLPTDLAGDSGAWSGGGDPGASWSDAPGSDQRQARPQISGSTTATDGALATTNPSRPTRSTASGRTGLDLSM